MDCILLLDPPAGFIGKIAIMLCQRHRVQYNNFLTKVPPLCFENGLTNGRTRKNILNLIFKSGQEIRIMFLRMEFVFISKKKKRLET